MNSINSADAINSLFEFAGGFFVAASCARLLQDKCVRGVSIWTQAFFFAWGVWNIAYYPSPAQTWSAVGALFVTTANFVWVVLALHYRRRR